MKTRKSLNKGSIAYYTNLSMAWIDSRKCMTLFIVAGLMGVRSSLGLQITSETF